MSQRDFLEGLKKGTDKSALDNERMVMYGAVSVSARLASAVSAPRDEFSKAARDAVGEYKGVLPLSNLAASWVELGIHATPEERRLLDAGAIAGAMSVIKFLEEAQQAVPEE